MISDSRFIKSVYGRYSYLSMLAILCSVIGQIGNTVIVGNVLGETALTVIGLALPIYCVFTVFGYLMGMGGAAVCSKYIGKGEYDRGKRAFTANYIAMVIVGIVITGIMLALLPVIVRLLTSGDASLYSDVYDYAFCTVCAGVFTMAMYLAFNYLRMDGSLTASFLLFLIQGVVIVVLDIIFLNAFDMGVKGVGYATLIGSALSSVFGLIYLWKRGKSVAFVKLVKSEFMTDIGSIFKVGSPAAMENACIMVRSFILNGFLLISFGGAAVSVISILNSIGSFSLVVIAGISGAIVPILGVFSAERDTASVRTVLKIAVIQGSIMTVVIAAFCMLAPSIICGFFGLDGGVATELATVAIPVFAASFLPSLFGNILTSMHMNSGRLWLANLISFLRHFGFVTGFALLFGTLWGVDGVWNAFWVTELATLIVVVICHLICSQKDKDINPVTLLNEKMEKKGNSVSISVENDINSIMTCVGGIGEFCERNDLSPKTTMLITLSLEEMLNSISTHSLAGEADLTMDVRIVILDGVIVIRIRNAGKEFNPIKYYEDKAKNIDKTDIDAMMELQDSLGIKMIIDATEQVDYRRTFGVNNLTVIL